jgi:hypothetical protein
VIGCRAFALGSTLTPMTQLHAQTTTPVGTARRLTDATPTAQRTDLLPPFTDAARSAWHYPAPSLCPPRPVHARRLRKIGARRARGIGGRVEATSSGPPMSPKGREGAFTLPPQADCRGI